MDEQGYQREGRSGGKHLSLGLFFFLGSAPFFCMGSYGGFRSENQIAVGLLGSLNLGHEWGKRGEKEWGVC